MIMMLMMRRFGCTGMIMPVIWSVIGALIMRMHVRRLGVAVLRDGFGARFGVTAIMRGLR